MLYVNSIKLSIFSKYQLETQSLILESVVEMNILLFGSSHSNYNSKIVIKGLDGHFTTVERAGHGLRR